MPATEKQLEAIQATVDSNVRIFAPPGSGKTFVIEHRYQYLVENGIHPNSILVVTFSKAMADEMGQRIKVTCPDANIEQISTIHAFCFRVLTRWDKSSPYFGWQVPKNWEVKKALDEAIQQVWREKDKPGYQEILAWIDKSKHEGLTTQKSQYWFEENLGERGNWLWQIRQKFDAWLKAKKVLLFSDMLFLTEYHLKNDPNFLARLKCRFPYVMIDEAQDTNYQAMRILLAIAEHTFVVGDVDQMMYRFQGARPELTTSNYAPEIKTVLLNKNFRSTETIIQSCQALIAHNYSEAGGPYPQEFMKDVSGVKEVGPAISFEMYETIEEESQAVAQTLLEQLGTYQPGDFFVGTRTRAQLGYLEGSLTRAGIKFINITGSSFWQSKHVSDVVGYIRLAVSPKDKEAFKKIYNIASSRNTDKSGNYLSHRWLGQEFLSITQESFTNIWYAPKQNKRYYYGVKDLLELVEDIQAQIKWSDNAGEVVQFVLDNCYIKWLQTEEGISETDESENGKLEDLNTVVDIASKYQNTQDFLAHVAEMVDIAEKAKDKNWNEFVVISTYHRLKGLERKMIIGCGWCEGYDKKTQQPRGLLPHTFSLIPPPQFGILPGTQGMSPIEDERCIAFVAASRAKERVFLTGCRFYRTWEMMPSRFVRELLGKTIDK